MPLHFGKKVRPLRRISKPASVKKIVRKELNRAVERKFINNGQALTVADWDGEVVLLSGVAQGDTALTRSGRKINLSSLSMRYQWDIVPPTDGSSAVTTVVRPKFVRVIVFQDKLGDGTVPTPDNVLQTIGVSNISVQHLEYTQIDRWRILHDKVLTINPGQRPSIAGDTAFGYTDSDIAQRYVKFYKKFKSLPVTYQGDDAAQGSTLKNAIYCLFLSDQDAAATSTDDWRARITWNARFRFTDI